MNDEHYKQKKKGHLLFTKKVTNLNSLAAICDASIDGKVSIDETHLVTIALSDTCNKVLNMAESGSNSSGCLPGPEPGLDAELLLAGSVVSYKLKVEIKVLKVANKLTTRAFDLDDLGMHLDFDSIWDIHRLG